MARATRTGTGLVNPPSRYSTPSITGGMKRSGTVLDARTASPVSPRLKMTMRPVEAFVATTANAFASRSIGRLPTARLTKSCSATPRTQPLPKSEKSTSALWSSSTARRSSSAPERPPA
jgi:hypothetical protein